ncbi:MAG: hypothetical protein NTY19_28755 [Planctomycetota bacterium]|nr:hypothetical protein [Planctomycetota bacterium]
MSQAYQPPDSSAQAPREKHGCLFWGCLTAVVLVLLTIGCSFVGYHYVVGKLQQAIEIYTAAAPESFPTVAMPDEQRQVIIERADAVRQRFEVEPTPDDPGILTDEDRTLVLTAEELNVLLQKNTELKDRFYVNLDGDEIKARISLPLSELGWKPLQGRFLNGEARIVVVLVDGEPHFYLRDVRVKGQPLPEELRRGIEKQDINPRAQNQQPQPPPARKLEKVEVKDGRLIIVLRKEPNAPAKFQGPAEAQPQPE